jgi:hypothetical protein
MYASLNKQVTGFQNRFAGERVKSVFLFQMSPWATDDMLPTSCRLGGTGVTCLIMAITILGPNTRILPKNKAKILFLQFQLLTM